MNYDTWKTTPPPEEGADFCSQCKSSPCECCEKCGAAPDADCDPDCPAQLRRLLKLRDFTINRQAERIAQLEADLERARGALRAISQLPGNLPDDRWTNAGGPNDARVRGCLLVDARRIAQAALKEKG
jgi:hypothetical protein